MSAAFLVGLGLSAAAFTPTSVLPASRSRVSAPVQMLERREAIFSLAAMASGVPLAASADARSDGIALLRKQAADAKAGIKPKPPPKNTCTVSKPCKDGAGLKWDPVALGVKKAESRKFFKKPTYETEAPPAS